MPAGWQRWDLSLRIAAMRTNGGAAELMDELLNRLGDGPAAVKALLDVALLRAAAEADRGSEEAYQRMQHKEGRR